MLGLDPLAPDTPRLPHRPGALTRLTASAALHGGLAVIVIVVGTMLPIIENQPHEPAADQRAREIPHLVFLAPKLPRPGAGGGGGGTGSDAITRRVPKPAPATVPQATSSSPPVENLPSLSIAIEARPLATGIFEEIGLPVDAASSATSRGPGEGGGVGIGIGTGVGPGNGPGLGPGSGGGSGGGVYRAGGGVSAPRLLKDVKPRYTDETLRSGIQGTVIMEVVVARDGRPSHIQVVRSLHPELDDEAAAAVAKWRFEPGRLAGEPVDVLVTIMLDFWIR